MQMMKMIATVVRL